MTLLIAWLIIGGLEMNSGLYFLSLLIWIGHISVH